MFVLLGFERRVAVRFLREGRTQTALIIVGVAAGVAVVAYISALIAGLQQNTIDETLGAQAHVVLSERDDAVTPALAPLPGTVSLVQTQARAQRPRSMIDWRAAVTLLEALPGVATVSPTVLGSALAVRGQATRSVALTGVRLERYERIVRLQDKIVAGTARLGPGDGILGRELADDLGVGVGDRISIVTDAASETTTGAVADAASDSLRITALVDLGATELNRRTAIVPLRTAQSLLALPGGATQIELALDDVWSARALARSLAGRLPYEIESWQETNARLVSALSAQSVSTGLIRAVVMIVVVLGTASVLVVSVVQKRREIGILRAMGATRRQVLGIFLLQGAIVGAAGSALGVALAAVMIGAFARLVRDADGAALFPIALHAPLVLQIATVATLCGVLAAALPARRAAGLDPADAIRL